MEDLKVLCNNNSLAISDFDCFKNITLHSNQKLAWLKDSVVSAYCNMVHRSCNNKNFIMNPLWYEDLRSRQKLDSCSIDELLLKQKTINYDILHRDNVFFPIVLDNQHWLLLRACHINATITIYDSLLHQHNNNKIDNLSKIAKKVGDFLCATQKLFLSKKNSNSNSIQLISKWEIKYCYDAVLQNNDCDCGLHVLTNLVFLVSGKLISGNDS